MTMLDLQAQYQSPQDTGELKPVRPAVHHRKTASNKQNSFNRVLDKASQIKLNNNPKSNIATDPVALNRYTTNNADKGLSGDGFVRQSSNAILKKDQKTQPAKLKPDITEPAHTNNVHAQATESADPVDNTEPKTALPSEIPWLAAVLTDHPGSDHQVAPASDNKTLGSQKQNGVLADRELLTILLAQQANPEQESKGEQISQMDVAAELNAAELNNEAISKNTDQEGLDVQIHQQPIHFTAMEKVNSQDIIATHSQDGLSNPISIDDWVNSLLDGQEIKTIIPEDMRLELLARLNQKQDDEKPANDLLKVLEVIQSMQPGSDTQMAAPELLDLNIDHRNSMAQIVQYLLLGSQVADSKIISQLNPRISSQIVTGMTAEGTDALAKLLAGNPQVQSILESNWGLIQENLGLQKITLNLETTEKPNQNQTMIDFEPLPADEGQPLSARYSTPKTVSAVETNQALIPLRTGLQKISADPGRLGINIPMTPTQLDAYQINPQHLIEQIVKYLKPISADAQPEINIQLDPPTLGKIVIKMAVEDGMATTKLLVENRQVQQIIESNWQALRENLNVQDIKVEAQLTPMSKQNLTGTDFSKLPTDESQPILARNSTSPTVFRADPNADLLPMATGAEKVFLSSEKSGFDVQVMQSQSTAASVDPEDLIEQIVKKVEMVNKLANSEMKIQLKPEYLGKMMIKIAVDEGVVTARFITESQQVKHLLEANLNSLKQSLEANGLKVERTEVNVQLDNGGNPNNWGGNSQDRWQEYAANHQNQLTYNRFTRDTLEGFSEEGIPSQEEEINHWRNSEGRVDFMV